MPPLPFDPPTQEEAALARDAALVDPGVQAGLGDRYAFVGAALHTQKIPGVAAADYPRLFDVWFYDYSSDGVVWAVVDLTKPQVTEIVPVEFRFQPPLAAAEIQRGVELAFGLEAVHIRFPAGPPPTTAILASGEGTACPVNRCALLGFIEERGPAMDFLVLVNLSEDRAMRIVEDSWQEVYRP